MTLSRIPVRPAPAEEAFSVPSDSAARLPMWATALLAAFGLAVIIALYFAFDYRQEVKELRANPEKIVQDEVQQVIKAVGQLMVLPEGEQPILYTVADPSKLKDQPFFARSKQGDKLLIYNNARKAILYDPVANKIMEVAPINIGNQPASAPAAGR